MSDAEKGAAPADRVTEPAVFFSRRTVLRSLALAGSVAATAGLYQWAGAPGPGAPIRRRAAGAFKGRSVMDETLTPLENITHYNNYYEFSTDKAEVAELAEGFRSRPWTVRIDGLVGKPRTWNIDELLKIAPAEERVYRHRCVEAWSMVVPWLGFPLAAALRAAEPLGSATYVAFTSLLDPGRFPNQSGALLQWPYAEGLRMDEAMHPLTLLAHGIYGKPLEPQNGAPLRLVVPWKYGFKGIKAIVKISLVEAAPATTWNVYAPREYGFYANVNPGVRHPRWSQQYENRAGEFERRATVMFNGYGEQVAHLYTGMDLARYF
jgi:sulfoxide reductase catalytic subunit YedY